MYDRLFSPIQIRGLELKNRVVLPAMGTRMAGEKGEITPRLAAYHAARAAGGCGLNIVEVAAVHTPSAPAHFVSISDDSLIGGHKKLTDAIHQNGGKAAIQLWQALSPRRLTPGQKCWWLMIWSLRVRSLRLLQQTGYRRLWSVTERPRRAVSRLDTTVWNSTARTIICPIPS